MYVSLRWRILLFTILPLLMLTAATLWMVNRSVTRRVRGTIYESLVHSSLVLEDVLAARVSSLAVTAQVIVRDPRFSSILLISGSSVDPQYRATVQKVAGDFNSITTADLFEVLDRQGRLLASSGRATCSAAARDTFVHGALLGRQVSGVLVGNRAQFQVVVTPVVVNRRVVGALLLGAGIARPLACELQRTTHSEVTFVSREAITGTSFDSAAERLALLATLRAGRPARVGGSEGQKLSGPAGSSRASDGSGAPAPPQPRDLIEAQGARQKYLTLIRPIPRTLPAARQVYVMQRSLDAETAFLRDVQAGLIRLGILAAAAALLAGVMVAASITRPVRRLVRGAEEMERGNYEFPLGDTRRDEIGYLSQRFQEMRQHERAYVSSLREAARVKSEFISVASHELRTPIAVIKAYVEMLVTGELGPAEQRKAFVAIDDSLARLTKLADDSTRMAELQSGRRGLSTTECDVAKIIQDALAFGTSGADRRQVEVALDVAPDLGSITADGPRLAQAVAALVSNGIRFTPDGGHVRVAASREHDELVIEVADDGVGIPEDKQRDLFNRPFMVRDSLSHHSSSALAFRSAGLGLGLQIARGIIQAHGGELLLASRLDRGSTFTIRLPLEPGAELKAA